MVFILKTCPFCGKKPVETEGDFFYMIACGYGKCWVAPRIKMTWLTRGEGRGYEVDAIRRAWNQRKVK